MRVHEGHRRSLAKGITYTAAVILADIVIILFVTHHLDTTVEVIVLTNLASLVIYYVHARIWNRVGWGRSRDRQSR